MDSFTSQTGSRLSSSRRRGFNLIEAAIVLGVIGLIIGGIWVAATAVTRANNVNIFISRVVRIADDTQSNFRYQNVSSFVMEPYLIAKGHYSNADNAPAAGYFYAKELGQNAIVEYSFIPGNGVNQGLSGLSIRVLHLDRSVCRAVLSKLIFYQNPVRMGPVTLTVQEMFDLMTTDCENGNGIDVRLDKVVR